ncbi:MAG: META domain-containing protein [Hymenobacteraceae bacterium]|nr:META domain-containing protein [Hymenobacteraceae bacterium]
MKYPGLIPLLFLLLLVSCRAPKKERTAVAGRDAAEVVEQSKRVVGTWQGTLPCADCPGINYTLQLLPDQTFQEELVYQERHVEPFRQTGSWKIDKAGMLHLQKPSGVGMAKFELTPDALVMLDVKGRRITSNMGGMYRLLKVNGKEQVEYNPEVWQEKFERGVDFLATGNEPFWSLEISRGKFLVFRALDAEETVVKTALPEPESQEGVAGILYRAETAGGPLIVQLLRQECMDNMSGERFSYAVSVSWSGKTYRGCGRYLSDLRLHAQWVLQEINGREISAAGFPRGVPSLEINLHEGRVYGHGGCNRIQGGLEVQGDRATFRQLASTRMACPAGMAVEDEFLRLLSGHTLRYQVAEEQLTMFQQDKPVLVFGKAAPPKR